MRPRKLRVVLVDDHLILREALKALLERQGVAVVADAPDGRAALEAVRRLRPPPDIVVLDVAMPVMDGIAAAREIARIAPPPGTHLILLSGLDDTRFVRAALQAGVRGFVLKSQGSEDLIHSIDEVRRGGLYISPGASQAFVDACRSTGAAAPDGPQLTQRERQVVQLVAEGKSTKQIAVALQISAKTAEFHRGRVMKKLSVHDTASLVRYAIRTGLVAP
ncbi:MAG: response regulator [Gemmatimonadales bacterium]